MTPKWPDRYIACTLRNRRRSFVVVVLALATALTTIALRQAGSALTVGALSQLVLIVVQTGLGEAVTKLGWDGLVTVHVPLAVLIFGLGTYLSSVGARLRRSAT